MLRKHTSGLFSVDSERCYIGLYVYGPIESFLIDLLFTGTEENYVTFNHFIAFETEPEAEGYAIKRIRESKYHQDLLRDGGFVEKAYLVLTLRGKASDLTDLMSKKLDSCDCIFNQVAEKIVSMRSNCGSVSLTRLEYEERHPNSMSSLSPRKS